MDKYQKVYIRDGYRCVFCGRFLLDDFDSWASLHTDHLVAKSHGGTDVEENLVTSCPTCNNLKGSFMPSLKLSPQTRAAYLQELRGHIATRRAEWMEEFLRNVSDWKRE